jgi:hypothetical protein
MPAFAAHLALIAFGLGFGAAFGLKRGGGRGAGAAPLALIGGPAAVVFAVFHGAGNGILTIARGTLPLAIFGPRDYVYRLRILGAPARIAQAAAPLAFSVLIDHLGGCVLIASSG